MHPALIALKGLSMTTKRKNSIRPSHKKPRSAAQKAATKRMIAARKKSLTRVSQATKKKPSKRLVARRRKDTVPGYYPNPIFADIYDPKGDTNNERKGPRHLYHVEIEVAGSANVWHEVADFVSKELAFNYARALNKAEKRRVRVYTD